MTQDRPSLGFEAELEAFDPSSWKVKRAKNTCGAQMKDSVAAAAEVAGFQSREPVNTARGRAETRRRRTGRNTQFNIKADPDVIARFVAIADAQGWVFGETLEAAVNLLEQTFTSNTKKQK